MTTGTFPFLLTLLKKYPKINFSLMSNNSSTLLYYEKEKKNHFVAGRTYKIVCESGSLQDAGFVVLNHYPVADEAKPIFEDHLRKHYQLMNDYLGFLAFRLLKPLKGNMYVILTQWDREMNYQTWQSSSDHSFIHDESKRMPPAYFLERPFTATYTLANLDEE